jgi:hypothetical protein
MENPTCDERESRTTSTYGEDERGETLRNKVYTGAILLRTLPAGKETGEGRKRVAEEMIFGKQC